MQNYPLLYKEEKMIYIDTSHNITICLYVYYLNVFC